jgi:gliding motility-associated-like protein
MGTCAPVSDQMKITFRKRPTINAGVDDTTCADASSYALNATMTNATGAVWSSSSGGGFFPATGLSTAYFLTPQDSTNGTVVLTVTTTGTGTCAPASDNLILTISPVPSADAGPPSLSVCKNDPSVSLNGSVVNATGGYWSTTGDGSFNDPNILNTVYSFGGNDIATGTVKMIFISQGNGGCNYYSDTMRINLTPATNVDAGPDRTICRTDFPITLQGSGASGVWSYGTPAQYGNINSLTSTYMPTAGESAGGTLKLKLTPTGSCAGNADSVVFTFINGPSVHINPLLTICTNVNTVTLSGTSTPVNGGNWTSTGGTAGFASTTNINTTYTLSSTDKTAGQVKFTYTIPSNGICNLVRDSATIRINPTPVVNAGPDQSLCANALSTVTMNGSYTVASGIQWTTVNGTGSISNSTVTNAQYNPMAGDIPLTPIKMVISTTGASFCSVQTDTMLINITPAPTAVIGSDTTMCADKTAQLTAVTTVASGGVWSTTGTGTFSPNNSAKTVVYTPSKADTSSASHSVTISYLTTGNGICAAVNASKIIHMTVKPIVMAGIDDTICSGQDSVALFASNFVNAPGILWTSTGTGTFSPSNTNISAYYIPSVDDKANGGAIIQLTSTGVAECDPVTDYKTLMIIPSPVASVNAGFDQIICRDESYAQMAGFILIATGAKWDCQGSPCSGSFYPNDQDLNARYIPSATDTAAGSVILRLTTTTGNGICAPVWDEMKLTIIDIPRVNAGNPQTVCADTAGIQLGGTINHATLIPPGYSWVSSGNGYFAPNAFVANPVYVPDATDKVNGQVSFTLTSTNNGTCHPYSASVLTTILPQPTISAGLDKATCANVSNITIAGTMTHATTATWSSTGSGSIAYNGANGLNITYTPSAIDDTAGTVTLTIRTASGLGSCKSVSDQMVLTIGPAPIVNAGVDHTICADNGNVAISGTVSAAATGGLWTTLGSGNFASNTSLNTTYKPSNADTTSHSVKLVLTSTGNGLCLPVQDTIQLAIVPKPVVVAGNTHICEVVNGAALNGIVNNAGGGIWTTSGSGTFAVNAATLNATYYPSAADASAGSVVLTLSSTSNGTCNAVSSTTNLAITRIPLANAGPDQFICQNTSTTVNAIMDPLATTYNWSTFTGTIVGNTTAYSFVADKDTAFILTVYDYKGCASIKDTVNVRTFQMPTLSLNGTSCFSDNNDITSTPTPGLPAVPGIYQWYNPGIMTGQNADELHPNVKGSYYLTFSYGGCSAISDTFTVNPSPTVAGIDKTNCANHVTTLATSSVTGGTTFQYIWSSDPSIVGANSDSSQIMVNTSLTFDTIPYRVTVRNNFGCSTNDSIYLVSVASPLITLQNDTLCQNQTTTLVADASNYGVGSIPPIESYFPTYTWTRDGVNLNNNSKTQLVTVPGQYIVQITIGDCIDNKDTSNVLYNKFAIFDLPDKTRFCKETDSVATLNATAQAQAGYTLSYFWSPTNDTTAVIKADEEGYYKVTVSSHIGNSSCPVSDSIFVRNVCAPRVFVPNVFTPDGTTNKNFKVFGSHYTNFKITIFSRWGEVIFSSEDLDFMNNVGWDGTYKGRAMPMGVYTYIIYYDGEDADYTGPYRKDGDILIMR